MTTDADHAARIAALEDELRKLKERLDEPPLATHAREVQKFLKARTCMRISAPGTLTLEQPTLFLGDGEIVIGKGVNFGVRRSPYLYGGYIYIDARSRSTKIVIGDDVHINNNSTISAEGEGIEIGARTLIGTNVEIIDTDGHDLAADRRLLGRPNTGKVVIEENVFIGSNVRILKSVRIGAHSVIANGSIVTRSIPSGVIAAGNPARVIKAIPA